MEDHITRFFENLAGRVHGPMSFRLIMQPLMAVLFALKDGRRDAREGEAPYLWAMFGSRAHRRMLLRQGWKSVGKIFVIALILDAVYQYITVRWFYPVEALVTAAALALVPYLLLRGLFTRLSRSGDSVGRPASGAQNVPRP